MTRTRHSFSLWLMSINQLVGMVPRHGANLVFLLPADGDANNPLANSATTTSWFAMEGDLARKPERSAKKLSKQSLGTNGKGSCQLMGIPWHLLASLNILKSLIWL